MTITYYSPYGKIDMPNVPVPYTMIEKFLVATDDIIANSLFNENDISLIVLGTLRDFVLIQITTSGSPSPKINSYKNLDMLVLKGKEIPDTTYNLLYQESLKEAEEIKTIVDHQPSVRFLQRKVKLISLRLVMDIIRLHFLPTSTSLLLTSDKICRAEHLIHQYKDLIDDKEPFSCLIYDVLLYVCRNRFKESL